VSPNWSSRKSQLYEPRIPSRDSQQYKWRSSPNLSCRESQLAYGLFYFLFFYVFQLIAFVFCYGRILILIRRQAKVMAAHGSSTSNAKQIKSNQVQLNVAKTMLFISASYAVSNLPISVILYYLILNVNSNLNESGYYISLFISFFYICTNPFIYAAKFDPVRLVLVRLMRCSQTSEQQTEGTDTDARVLPDPERQMFVSFFYIYTNPFFYAAKFDPVRLVLVRLMPCRKTSGQKSGGAENQ